MYEGLEVDEVSTDEAKLFASIWVKDATGRVLGNLGNRLDIAHQDNAERKTTGHTSVDIYDALDKELCVQRRRRKNISSNSENSAAGVVETASKGWPHAEDAAKPAVKTALHCPHDLVEKHEANFKTTLMSNSWKKNASEDTKVYSDQVNFLKKDEENFTGNCSLNAGELNSDNYLQFDEDLLGIWNLNRKDLCESGYIPEHLLKADTALNDDLSQSIKKRHSDQVDRAVEEIGELKFGGTGTGTERAVVLGLKQKSPTEDMVASTLSKTEYASRVTSRLDPLAADFKPELGYKSCRGHRSYDREKKPEVASSQHGWDVQKLSYTNEYVNFDSGSHNSDSRHGCSKAYRQCKYCCTSNSPTETWCFKCGSAFPVEDNHWDKIGFQTLEDDENKNPNSQLHSCSQINNGVSFETFDQQPYMDNWNCYSSYQYSNTDINNVRHKFLIGESDKISRPVFYPIQNCYTTSHSLSPPSNTRFQRQAALSYEGNHARSFKGNEGTEGSNRYFYNRNRVLSKVHNLEVENTHHFNGDSHNVVSDTIVDYREQPVDICAVGASKLVPTNIDKYTGDQKVLESRENRGGSVYGHVFDFEYPSNDQDCSSFKNYDYINQFVQAGIARQVKHWYGINPKYLESNIYDEKNRRQTKRDVSQNPEGSIFQRSSGERRINNHLNRMYSKKKFFHPKIQPPQSPRNKKIILKDICDTTSEFWTQKEKGNLQRKEADQEDERRQSKPVEVPRLPFEDLESYDEILTLIRTSREESLPYLCLPEEVVLYVFSFLTHLELARCARVCKQFYRIVSDQSLWKEITLRKRNDLDDDILHQIAKKRPISLTITQSNGRQVSANGLRAFFRECGDSLEELDFSASNGGALLGESVLLHISTRCTRLRSLDISWCNVGDAGINAVVEVSPRLESLCINGCQAVTDAAINSLVTKHGESLRILEVFGCFNITQSALLFLAQHCPNLETLNIGQCHKITDVSMSHLAMKLQSLENLDLRGCIKIRDSAVKDIAEYCSTLSTLVLANCPQITDASLISIAANSPRIRRLDFCGCGKVTDRGVQALAKSCSRLEVLDLSSTSISQKSLSALANYCSNSMKSLKLSFCYNVTESSILHLVKKCKSLRLLHLYGCKRLRNLDKIREGNCNLIVEGESSSFR